MTSRHEVLADPVSGLHDLIEGYRRTQVICATARLGVADLLAGGPLTLDELAAECAVSRESLGRLMRALVGLDVCTLGPEGYRTTEIGRALESTAAGGAHEQALATADHLYTMWADLTDHLCRDGTALRPVDVPTTGNVLDDDEARQVAPMCAVPAGSTLVDLGGRGTALLAELLREHPGSRGIHVGPAGADVRERFAEVGLGGRVRVTEVDAFRAVPAGLDVYLLCLVLREHDDERASAVLRAVRHAMRPGARLLVVEELVADDPVEAAERSSLGDLHLLVATGGRERTETEYAALLSAAGFRHERTAPTVGRFAVVEARPA